VVTTSSSTQQSGQSRSQSTAVSSERCLLPCTLRNNCWALLFQESLCLDVGSEDTAAGGGQCSSQGAKSVCSENVLGAGPRARWPGVESAHCHVHAAKREGPLRNLLHSSALEIPPK
jgi:hypothetical protein